MCSSCASSSYLEIWAVLSVLIVLFKSVGAEAIFSYGLPGSLAVSRVFRCGRTGINQRDVPFSAAGGRNAALGFWGGNAKGYYLADVRWHNVVAKNKL